MTDYLRIPWLCVIVWRRGSGTIVMSRPAFRSSRSKAIDFSRVRLTACCWGRTVAEILGAGFNWAGEAARLGHSKDHRI